MPPEPQPLGIILGGASVEHTISIRSARAVIAAADPERWYPVPFAVSPSDIFPVKTLSYRILTTNRTTNMKSLDDAPRCFLRPSRPP